MPMTEQKKHIQEKLLKNGGTIHIPAGEYPGDLTLLEVLEIADTLTMSVEDKP